ncbi:MAG TPA: bifunctional 4-hydroxy-2-oxoglutarate aldolase/2-dehydro-3-deoxy-phosphogluconate aldolase [Candidatus Agrococcus pullicola]|uniref:Bifunctional 4-hydroxy-2-oxoglutarate aldolase/2-dehydro-3-deoxy-phosphogluconate aldolase n=1 Tax=Candidatus Agrococcus pullicola TaxID=2838429 RepID=A0A9D1YXS9_9MICO|nr:bifunctional 4-hydroxy-2-oxoglutarate aldolase/2-dehydro-3-deoxy-phosphogluconate aldolase [Candidatus Agrococcus pullicola]
MNDRLERVQSTGVFAVLRAPTAQHAIEASRALVRGGITGLEVTYSTPDAAAVIRELVAEFGDAAHVGAGTVTSAQQADEAVAAGASFLVSPGTLPSLTESMLDTGAVVMTGAMTPSEVMTAIDAGTHVVKLFPASLGGPAFLKALRGPFPGIPFMPTGGVSAMNLGEWFSAGAVAAGAGGDLVPAAALQDQDWGRIETIAGHFAAALREVRA